MNFVDLIENKKQGYIHTKEEICFIVESLMKGTATDAQVSSWLMAVCFNGLIDDETAWLTESLANSGEKINFGDISSAIVDKHSTGGVGDKVTITLIPLLAAAGVPVAKLADRGLGHVAGTVDKLESIPNFKTDITTDEIVNQVKNVNGVIASQDENLAPADKKLQVLRDLTGTVESDVLIASSILSKKIACGANNIILDIKYGSGAFMKTPEEAIKLSKLMVKIGKMLHKSVLAVITSMEEPLGRAIGNSIEVIESMEFLKGNIKTGDLAELTYYFAESTLLFLEMFDSREEARKHLESIISSGKAIEKVKELVKAQGGEAAVTYDYDKFVLPAFKIECEAKKSGFVNHINAHQIAKASKALGASRENNSMPIDLSAGIYLNKKSGEYVNKGEILYTIYSNDEEKTLIAQKYCDDAFLVRESKPAHKKLIYKVIGSKDEDNDV